MKITVELSEKEMAEVMRHTGLRKRGPAIRAFVADALALRRRRDLLDRVMAGPGRVALPDWRKLRAAERSGPWPS